MGFVYKLTFASGKSYIGATKLTIAERFRHHKMAAENSWNKNHNNLIYRAWRKYGEPTVKMIVETSNDKIFEEEIWFICNHGTISPHGYNSTYGGEGGVHCEETRKKISKSRKGMKFTEEH